MKIFICGDVINQFSDIQFISSDLTDLIGSADYSICNFEGALASKRGINSCMIQNENSPKMLKQAGFDLCLLANNHTTDFGEDGLRHTIKGLQENGLDTTGAGFSYEETYTPKIIEMKGYKVAIVNICEAQPGYFKKWRDTFGYAWMGDPSVERRIEDLSHNVDYTIVVCHAGFEHFNMPLPYFREKYKAYCDAGACCVVAMHPHIAQGIENYKGKPIFYSLGNFYFPRKLDSDSTDIENQSFSVILKMENGNLDYDLVFHKMDNLIVRKCEKQDVDFDINQLNKELKDPLYETLLRTQLKDIYHTLIEPHYMFMFNGTRYNDSFPTKVRRILKYLIRPDMYKNRIIGSYQQLLRMTENESYRTVTETAMRVFLNYNL